MSYIKILSAEKYKYKYSVYLKNNNIKQVLRVLCIIKVKNRNEIDLNVNLLYYYKL